MIDSQQTFKDLVGGLHLYHTKDISEELSQTLTSNHLCRALIDLDDDLHFPKVDINDLLPPEKDRAKFFGKFSEGQNAALKSMSSIEHGMVPILGFFGSGKTDVMMGIVMAMITKDPDVRVMWAIAMNDGVNKVAGRVADVQAISILIQRSAICP
jgi:hypothetical protein